MSNPPSPESAISGFEWKSIGKPPSLLERIRDPETLLPPANIESPLSAPPDPTKPTSPRRGKPSLLGRIDLHSPPTTAGPPDIHPPAARMNGHTPVQDIFKIPLIHPTTVPTSTSAQSPKPAMSSFCISLPVVTVAPATSTIATPMQLDLPNAAATVETPSTNLLRPPPTTNGTPSSSSVGQHVLASSLSATDLYKHISAAGVERMELDEVKHARKHVLDAQQEYLRRYEETRSAAVREKEHMDKLVSAVLDALAKTEKVQERQEKRWAEENERLEKLLKAKEEEERRLREEEAQRIEAQKEAEAAAQKAKEEAEAAAKAAREKREAEEAETRARAAEEKAREEALAAQAARARAKAEEERQEQERQERLRLEAEAKAKDEERLRLEAEAKAKEEQAVRARELRDRIKAKEKAQAEEQAQRARELYERLEEKADIERVRAEAKAIAQEAASGRARRLEEDRVQRTSNTPTHTAEPLDEGQGALAKLVSSTFATSRAPSQISNDGQPQRPPPTIAAPSTSSTGRIAPEAHAFPCDGPTTSVHLRPTPVLNSLHPPAQTAGPFDSSRDGRTTVMRGAEVNPDVKPPVDLAPPSTSPLNRPIQLVAESIKTSPSMSSMRQPRSLWPPSSSVGSQATSSGSASRMDVATLGTAHVQTRKSSGQNGTVRPVSKNSGTFIKPEPVDALIPPTPMLTQAPQPPPRPQQQSHPDVTANPAPPPPPPSKAQPPPPAISAPPAEILNSRAPPRAVLPSLSTPVQPAARRPPPASLPQKPTVLPALISTRDEVAAPKVTVPTLQSFNSRNGDRSGRPPANINSDVNRPPSSINAERSVATGVSPPVRVSEPQHAAPPAVPAHWRAEHDDDAWVITPGGGSDRHSQRYRSPTPDRRYDHYSPEPERYPYPPRPSRYEPPSPPGRKRRMDSQRDNAPYKRPRYDERSRSPHSRRAYSGSTSDRAYTPPSPRDRYRPPPRPISPMARRSPIPSFSPEPPISPYQSSIGSRRSVDWSLPDTRPYSPELRQAGTSSSARQLPPPARPLSPARRPFIPPLSPPPPPLAGRMSRIAPDDHQRAQSGKKAARPRIDTNPSSAPIWRGKPVPVPVPTSTRHGPPDLLTRMSSGGGPRHGPPGSEQGRARRGNVRGRGRGGGNAARGGRGGYRDLESRITG